MLCAGLSKLLIDLEFNFSFLIPEHVYEWIIYVCAVYDACRSQVCIYILVHILVHMCSVTACTGVVRARYNGCSCQWDCFTFCFIMQGASLLLKCFLLDSGCCMAVW